MMIVYSCTVETWDLNLEEAEARIATPLTKIALYRIRVELPYLFQRYFLRRAVQLVPFANFDHCYDEITLN